VRSCWSWIALAGASLLTTGCTVIEARSLAREGNEAYLASDYRTAIQKYEQALDLDPQTPNLYLNLGYAYFSVYDPASEDPAERGAAKAAVQAFEHHLLQVPGDESAKVFRIKTLLKSAPFDKELADKALATFLGMLADNPADHEARQYLITMFIDCRRYEDAVTFFQARLREKPDDLETMKILAIIADKSKQTQAALEWYWKRAEVSQEPEKKASMFYEVGTYAWNLLHYQPDRHRGVEAIKLADQGAEACLRAMALKDRYAEAMIYANLLYLKRVAFEPDEQSRFFSQNRAFDLRKAAGEIMLERKKAEEAAKGGPTAGEASAEAGAEAAGGGSDGAVKPSN